MPQVKVGHLRRIPAGPAFDQDRKEELGKAVSTLLSANASQRSELQTRIDELVAEGYELSHEQRALIDEWAREAHEAA
jgi:hypothetical protein